MIMVVSACETPVFPEALKLKVVLVHISSCHIIIQLKMNGKVQSFVLNNLGRSCDDTCVMLLFSQSPLLPKNPCMRH